VNFLESLPPGLVDNMTMTKTEHKIACAFIGKLQSLGGGWLGPITKSILTKTVPSSPSQSQGSPVSTGVSLVASKEI
jgi:hypothetical protein